MRRQESGVCSAGFITTVQPAASAGPHFQATISIGKFQGMICPATPPARAWCSRIVAADRDRLAVDLVGPAGVVARQSITSGRSALRLSLIGLPLSSVSSSASSSMCDLDQVGELVHQAAAIAASILRQGPESNALRAALTARSMSAASPSATWAMTSSVAGLIVSNVLPLSLSRHLPSISILVWSELADFATWLGCRGHWSFSLLRSPSDPRSCSVLPCIPWRHLMTDRCRHSSGGVFRHENCLRRRLFRDRSRMPNIALEPLPTDTVTEASYGIQWEISPSPPTACDPFAVKEGSAANRSRRVVF